MNDGEKLADYCYDVKASDDPDASAFGYAFVSDDSFSVAVPFVRLSPLVRVIDDDYGIIASLIPCISVTLAPRKLRFFLLPASA